MILQSISKNPRHQNWFSVVIEIFIVVAGIFIGLQVNALNSARLDAETERTYLERLLADMEESVSAQSADMELYISLLVTYLP